MPKEALPAKLCVTKVENAVAFELDLFSGADTSKKVQLSAPVVVGFDVPAEIDKTKSMGLIHYMDNGEVEVIPVTLDENGKAMATIRSFSVFVLANIELSDAPVENTIIGTVGVSDVPSIDEPAENNNAWVLFVVGALVGLTAVAIAVVMFRRKTDEL